MRLRGVGIARHRHRHEVEIECMASLVFRRMPSNWKGLVAEQERILRDIVAFE